MSIEEPSRFVKQGTLAVQTDAGTTLTLAPVDLRPLPDPRATTKQALHNPQDFPSIVEAIVPGDSIAIAADPNVPQLEDVIMGVLDALDGCDFDRIDVLLGEDASDELRDDVIDMAGDKAMVHVHTPENRDSVGYLAAGESADPIYLNRILLDADLVLPIAIARPDGGLDPRCETGGVLPAMADRNSQQRFRDALWHKRHVSPKTDGIVRDEATEATWLLGVQLLVEVMPTVEGLAAEIAAGSPKGLRRVMLSQVESSWKRSAPSPPSLVVACIDGNRQQHNWGNIARAVYAANRIVDVGGTIAVCSEVSELPGPALARLASDEPLEDVLKELRKDTSSDALVANVLARVREESRLVLATDLPSERIEDLGMGVIEDLEDLDRLIGSHESVIILRGAQFCSVQ